MVVVDPITEVVCSVGLKCDSRNNKNKSFFQDSTSLRNGRRRAARNYKDEKLGVREPGIRGDPCVGLMAGGGDPQNHRDCRTVWRDIERIDRDGTTAHYKAPRRRAAENHIRRSSKTSEGKKRLSHGAITFNDCTLSRSNKYTKLHSN